MADFAVVFGIICAVKREQSEYCAVYALLYDIIIIAKRLCQIIARKISRIIARRRQRKHNARIFGRFIVVQLFAADRVEHIFDVCRIFCSMRAVKQASAGKTEHRPVASDCADVKA